jgi:hypothetical protein
MALVHQLEKGDGSRDQVHMAVKCEYKVFRVQGETYLQINTFGSPTRVFHDIPSQTVQFGPEGSAKLREILEREVFATR